MYHFGSAKFAMTVSEPRMNTAEALEPMRGRLSSVTLSREAKFSIFGH